MTELLLLTALERREWCVAAFRRCLPLRNVRLERIELLLELVTEDVDVEGGSVVHTPHEDYGKEDTTRPAVPEPDGSGQHGEDSVRVLDAHESRLLQEVWQGKDEFADPSLSVRLAQPCKASRTSGSDLIAAAYSD